VDGESVGGYVSIMTDESDWRLLPGDEEYFSDLTLFRRRFTEQTHGDDHAHCEFCWAKFMEESRPIGDDEHVIVREGYTTEDSQRWICDQCFRDFHERFSWKVSQH
jgi:hypothetical protein